MVLKAVFSAWRVVGSRRVFEDGEELCDSWESLAVWIVEMRKYYHGLHGNFRLVAVVLDNGEHHVYTPEQAHHLMRHI